MKKIFTSIVLFHFLLVGVWAQNSLSFRSGSTIDYTQSSHSNNLPFHLSGNVFSVDLWVSTSATGLRSFLAKGTIGVNLSRFVFGINATNNLFIILAGTSSNLTINSNNTYSNFRNSTWRHVGVVVDRVNNDVKFYVDGVVDSVRVGSSINFAVGGTSEGVLLGRSSNGVTGEFSGAIDEVKIWTDDRSTSYLSSTYRNNELSGTLPSSLVLYYKFNEGTGGGDNTSISSVIDHSQSGLNGTLISFSRTGTSSNFITDTKSLPSSVSAVNVCNETFTISWAAPTFNAANVTGYQLDVSTSSGFNTFLYQNQTVFGSTQFKLSGLTNGTIYFYRIRAQFGGVFTGYSSTQNATPAVCNRIWQGTASSVWHLGSNWVGGNVPESGDNVELPNASNYPQASGNIRVGNLNISGSSARLRLSPTLGDTFTISGILSGSNGTIEGNGNARLNLTSTSSSNTLRMYNPVGVTTENMLHSLILSTSGQTTTLGTALQIGGALQVNAGSILVSNGNLTLLSSSSGTAIVRKMGTGASIQGNVKVSVFIPGGLRAFRFLGHPFSSAISIGQLKTGIIVTGSGGSTNNFDNTTTNNPSVFNYVNASGNSSNIPDPGWQALASAQLTDLNWDKGMGLRVLVRGDRSQGVSATTPNETNILLEGALNDGNDVTVMLSKTASSSYNLVSNPYCSNVDLNLCTQQNVSTNAYIWDLGFGTRGAYQTYSFVNANSCIIAAYTSFFLLNNNSSTGVNNASITFRESAKVSNIASGSRLLKQPNSTLQLMLFGDSIIKWDRLTYFFGNDYTTEQDSMDAIKFLNPEVSMYSQLASGSKLAIDFRKEENQKMSIGFDGIIAGNYRLRFSNSILSNKYSYYLWDGNNRIRITEQLEYAFSVDSTNLNTIKNRFKIELESQANGLTQLEDEPGLFIYPNPSQGIVRIQHAFNSDDPIRVSLYQQDGKIVEQMELNSLKTSEETKLDFGHLENGCYIIIIEQNGKRYHQRLVIAK